MPPHLSATFSTASNSSLDSILTPVYQSAIVLLPPGTYAAIKKEKIHPSDLVKVFWPVFACTRKMGTLLELVRFCKNRFGLFLSALIYEIRIHLFGILVLILFRW